MYSSAVWAAIVESSDSVLEAEDDDGDEATSCVIIMD